MIRTARVLFCEEEHGYGDVIFPEEVGVDFDKYYPSATALRRAAKKAGWKRINGADYCPDCAATIEGPDKE